MHLCMVNLFIIVLFAGGSDFIPIPTQTLTFPAGSEPNDQMPFNVQINPDNLVEGDETVSLMANSPSNFADVNPDSATLIIDDDDCKYIGFSCIFSQVILYVTRFLYVS